VQGENISRGPRASGGTARRLRRNTHAPLSPEAQAALSRPCMQTGSRITLKEGECSSHPGRLYTREQLDSTGSFDVAEALRKLDPSIF
jgi:hypothetical protein